VDEEDSSKVTTAVEDVEDAGADALATETTNHNATETLPYKSGRIGDCWRRSSSLG
jgi:hypothetical protein